MKYLFYDSESIDNKHRYSFTFGYLITDENFNVIKPREDIVFNPDLSKDNFDWWAYKKMLKDSYPKEQVNSSKPFNYFYPKIKKLLQGDDVLCIGFEINEDVKYLLSNCERYGLEPIDFKYIDVREIIKYITGQTPRSLSLEFMRYKHTIISGAHRSDVDAEMTMQVLREVLKQNKKSLNDILREGKDKLLGESKNFCYGFNGNIFDIKHPRESSYEKIGNIRVRKPKPDREDWIMRGTANDVMFTRFLDYAKPTETTNQFLKDKKISISLNYEFTHYQNMLKLVQLIVNAGGTYVKKASLADIFVKQDVEMLNEDGTPRQCTKLNFVKETIEKEHKRIEIMEFDDFLSLLNLDREKLEELPKLNIEYLKDNKYGKSKKNPTN